LLKLKKLHILGFKSFCDRTELKFHGEGVACIVGPNGCGKSNLSDAIAWVLGEQSARTLRGARMEDVIFAGTRDRNPLGMAEVSLTLIDPDVYDGEVPAAPEIEIEDDLSQEDWDEDGLRAQAAGDVERYIEEVQPRQTEELEVPGAAAPADGANQAAASLPSSDDSALQSAAPGDVSAASDVSVPAVVLKIRRRKFKPVFRAGEIVVTRRLFRSGVSEYLLNGKLCRLRDIQDIFLGTGLGPESYAIIEQGRIGQILSSKPTDRRAIIEEAAGITKFKTRKRLAEARLEEARQNLARVNDIFDEVTRQMNSLKRQASKAERYARLREEMRSKLRLVLASKLAQLQEESVSLESALSALAAEVQSRGEAVHTLEAEQAERTQRGYAIEAESRRARERLSEIHRESERAAARLRSNEERCLELAARSAAASAEIAQTEERLASLRAEREAQRQHVEAAAAELVAVQQEAALRQQEAAAAAAALSEVERQQEERRVAILEAVAAESAVRNQITRSQEQATGLERELRRLHAEWEAARTQVESLGGQRGQLQFEFESASGSLASLSTQIEGTRARIGQQRAAEAECKQRLDGLRGEYAAALGRKGSLEGLIAEHGYSTESVRRLFQSGTLKNGFTPEGVLADFLEVEPRYEPVVEDFLRDELNYIVVKSWDAADEGLRLLRSDVDGRATFLVHPEDSQAKFSFLVDDAADQAPPGERVVALKRCIRVLNGFGKSLEVILPKLRDGYIVPDPGLARELALGNPDAFFLSETGECFHNVTVTGGKQRNEGPLSMKRELRELMRQMTGLEEALREEERRVAALGKEMTELSSLLERLEGERREAEKLALTSGHNLQQLEAEAARMVERTADCEHQVRQVTEERDAAQAEVAGKQADLVSCETDRSRLEGAAEAAQQSLAGLRQERERTAQAASETMARLAAVEERRRAAEASLGGMESLTAEVANRLEALQVQMESAAVEKTQREAENRQLGEQLLSLATEREAAEAQEAQLLAESEQVRARLAQLEEELHQVRGELDAARDRRAELSTQLAKLQSDQQHMAETAMNELGAPPEELAADATLVKVVGEALAQEETAYREMRARLEAMGPVNMMALEEYQEAAQRHAFLDGQRKDLLESISNTQAAIREIETVSQHKFKEAFERINENFQAAFRKLFGGGNAFMKLTDEENTAESGIDVVASPPGKRLQNVLLLSGGEKALTAIALLVGIFQYTPSPFCILDEVDAPLDEANIGRFTQLVREMSVRTQFVLITHSKQTMSIAPVMYGVTMQEPGVSKLVSVRFQGEGERQAASA
jgi:chromosome segregation protein